MPIKITDDPDVSCTRTELARYTADYQQAYMMFAGTPPTLAEFIRRKQAKAKKPFGGMAARNG